MTTPDAIRKIADKLEAGEDPQEWGGLLELLGRELRRGKIKAKRIALP